MTSKWNWAIFSPGDFVVIKRKNGTILCAFLVISKKLRHNIAESDGSYFIYDFIKRKQGYFSFWERDKNDPITENISVQSI